MAERPAVDGDTVVRSHVQGPARTPHRCSSAVERRSPKPRQRGFDPCRRCQLFSASARLLIPAAPRRYRLITIPEMVRERTARTASRDLRITGGAVLGLGPSPGSRPVVRIGGRSGRSDAGVGGGNARVGILGVRDERSSPQNRRRCGYDCQFHFSAPFAVPPESNLPYRNRVGHNIVRHIWADGLLSRPSPSFGCLK